jgi:molybdopterin-guanine dinucleotide biosynthesis protein
MKNALILFLSVFFVIRLIGEEKFEFNRDIRPILSDACFHCHGPDEKERKGGLRLDLESHAYKAGKSGFEAIIRGNAKDSEIITRIHLPEDDSEHMPPPESGKSLTEEQKKILAKWIDQGAEYQGHWAFISPERPEVPKIKGADHPIDSFLQNRLAEEGLGMQEEASKEVLIRRASLDLTGLPPTLQEIDDFLADKTDFAYEKVLNRLLASPHYGERMSLEWLDLARYADSNGFQSDGSRDMWLWRDWLINAFNRNLPFDQFTIEQLAGDMLENPSDEQIIATGFNRNHRLNGEGGRIVEEWFVETVIDRVETTGTTWLALTMTCARCHDHKYDPISQKEFFEFFAYFNSNEESGVLAANGKNGFNTPPFMKVPSEDQKAKITELDQNIKEQERLLKSAEKKMNESLAEWITETRDVLLKQQNDSSRVWKELSDETVISKGGATFKQTENGTWLASGKNPPSDTYEIRSSLDAKQLGGILIEAFPHKSFKQIRLGRSGNGNFVLTGLDIRLESKNQKTPPIVLKLDSAEASFAQKDYPPSQVIKNASNLTKKNSTGWAVHGFDSSKSKFVRAMFLAKTPIQVPEDAELIVTMYHKSRFTDHNVGNFKIHYTENTEVTLDGGSSMPTEVVNALKKEPNALKPEERKTLDKYFRDKVPNPVSIAKSNLERSKKAKDSLMAKVPSTMIMKEKASPKDAFILNRGEYDQPTDKVARSLPAVLPALPEGASNDRLGLAQWLVSGDHPLTARVWVNRIWERFFGVGIVKTSENFGSQAEWPTHPELLDWLAVEFVRPTTLPSVGDEKAKSWDMKAMIKFIMLSDAYKQKSSAPGTLFKKDPENRLLSRGPRMRLIGEVIRDQALFVGGLLVPKLGGPSVRPYMPKGVWSETNRYGNLKNYTADTGEGLYRRSMYTIWKRTAAPPSMLLFDAPNREVCNPKRSRTNTPLQALALMNEVTFVEAARGLAELMIKKGGTSPKEKITTGYRMATGFTPDSETLAIMLKNFNRRNNQFKQDKEAAKSLVNTGESSYDSSLNIEELAAYTVTANVLLNLDQVLTKN